MYALHFFCIQGRNQHFFFLSSCCECFHFLFRIFFFFKYLSAYLFFRVTLHSEFMTSDWFGKNLHYVMQYTAPCPPTPPKTHNHQGTACLFAVLKAQNSWQSIKARCVCVNEARRVFLLILWLISSTRLPQDGEGRHRGIVAVSMVLPRNPLFKIPSTKKLEVCLCI